MHILRLAALPVALLTALGCQSTVTGNEGNFKFSYDADDAVFDFNKPIAIGAFLDLGVTAVEDDGPVVLTDAKTDDASVMEVTTFADNLLTVGALADGEILLEVTGTRNGGEPMSDSVNLLARAPEVHRIGHTCGEDGATAYLSDSAAFLTYEFSRENGQAVIGYGLTPVSSSSSEVVVDTAYASSVFHRIEVGAAGQFTLTSEIDASETDVTVVLPGDVDGVAEPFPFVLEDIDVGDTNPFFVRPTTGGRTLCQADLQYTVASTSPDICAVRAIEPFAAPESAEGREPGWFEIEGLTAGTCTYTVTYPQGEGGAGTSGEFSFTIQP